MENHSFVRMVKLKNVTWKSQLYNGSENVRKICMPRVPTFRKSVGTIWQRKIKRDFRNSGTTGKCIEARELIIMLPPSLIEYDHEAILKYFTGVFAEKYDVACQSALHHNKTKTNLHIHLIFSERKALEEPEQKIAKRNMFYDETGKHVRTKKRNFGCRWKHTTRLQDY